MMRLALAVFLAPICAAAGIEIHMTGGAFEVTGWKAAAEPPDGWASVFAVYAGGDDAPAMLGRYTVERGELIFRPRWPVSAGVHVRAVFHANGASAEAGFDIAKAAAGLPTRIEHVYPSTAELPANALKLYICFSAPMRRGEAWQHIRLLDEQGAPVELPFLEIDQELWDPSNTRLTVLFDPGRIKRGLLPLNESGPNLQEGRRYTLALAKDWLDAKNEPLAASFTKAFRVIAEERAAVDPKKWRIASPPPGTRDALVVRFPRPLDAALLERTITVGGVSGKVAVAQEETEWRFTPDTPWKAGGYQLSIDTTLEDVAGNRVGRPFDVDTFSEVTREIQVESVAVAFRIGK